MRATIYPPADTKTQWHGPGNAVMPGITKLLLHTTETGTWPGYSSGASAPTLTYHPTEHRWRQHFFLDHSARALVDPEGTVVRENRDNVVQVEIICSCDRAFADRYHYPHVTELDEQAHRDLGHFAAFLHDEWGLPLRAAPLWLPYPSSYGNSAARMSGSQFDAFTGICGHQHASGNSNGDPGSLDVDRILTYASGRRPQPQEDDDMALNDKVNDEHNVKQVLNRIDRFIGNEAARDRAAKARDEALLAAIEAAKS